MSVLTDPGWVVPPLPPGDGGGMDRLRRAVCRFSDGDEHAERRSAVERALATVPPAELRAAARDLVRRDPTPPVVPRAPLAVLAAALGIADPAAVAGLVPPVAAAYHPGSAPSAAADAAAQELLRRVGVVRTTLLVQSCLPVAALLTGALATGALETGALETGALETGLDRVLTSGSPPVPATRRWSPATGETITVPLSGIPFGEGPRRCPAEQHALALATGVLEGLSPR